MKKISIAFLFAAFVFNVQAQLAPPSNEDLQNNQTLEKIFKEKFENDRARAEQIAAETGIQLREEMTDGTVIEFAGFDANGNMLFQKTDNIGAARTISTDKVWPGGSVGTSLTGAGMTNHLGVWDGGAVRTTHQEFQGRVTQADGATSVVDHATHVSGTMVAGGISANAKGMSYQAPLRAFDWNNDNSEMISAASSDMLISNHSYGAILGWYYNTNNGRWYWYGDLSISATEDYQFGFYGDKAQAWDQIAFNNPYYLICKAAGNDRGDNKIGSTWYYSNGTQGTGTAPGADGGSTGYDCMDSWATGKNILTVGAVSKIGNNNSNNGWTKVSDVVMSSFSGWGPTDDGRIKPDVVAAGVNLYSAMASSNSAYGTTSGTSMATPNASGSLILVQQHYNNLKGNFMRSATLKGLAIHTADEAGTAGPDYKFGWGLLNIAKAIQMINEHSTNLIAENTLNNGATYSHGITIDGSQPLRITICWTDRAGTPPSPSLDPPNIMLVNDLDIRLTRTNDNTVFQPYVLNPASPASAAITGDNIRDNVEQIYLAVPTAGNYILTVTHKGNLVGGSQNYSLLISGQMAHPKAIVAASSYEICTTQTVTFTDASSGNPSVRRWYFPGGTPSTSTSATETVTYSTAGKFPVALFVSNNIGSDSVYLHNYITVGGQTLPFNETFEANSSTASLWKIENPNGDSTWRAASVNGTAPGNKAMCMPFYNTAGAGRVDYLISPLLSFRGHTNVNLTFQYAYTRDPATSTDSLRISVSTDCGSSYTRLASFGENGSGNFRTANETSNFFTPADSNEWASSGTISIDLNAYSGLNNIRLRFEGVNNSSNNLYLDNIQITGMPQPPIANFYTGKKTVCANDQIVFFDSTQNFPIVWEWTFDGANIITSTDQNPIVTYAQVGTYAVKLKVTNAAGADSITKTGYITVLPTSAKPNIRNIGITSFCYGDSSIIITDSTNVNSFEWYRDNILIAGENQPMLMVKDSGSYTVKTLNANGCGMFSEPLLMNIFRLPEIPTVSSNLTGGVICGSGTAVLTSSAISDNQWYKNDEILTDKTARTLSTQDAGNYKVRVTNGSCYTESNVETISTADRPQTSAITGETTAEIGSTKTYSVTSDLTSSIFNWTVTNGVVQSGQGTNTAVIKWNEQKVNANVRVRETAASGCTGSQKTLNIEMTWRVGIAENEKLKSVQIYPNPAQKMVFIELLNESETTATAILKDITGREISQTDYALNNGQNKLEFNFGELQSGIYIMELQSGKRSVNVKLVVE